MRTNFIFKNCTIQFLLPTTITTTLFPPLFPLFSPPLFLYVYIDINVYVRIVHTCDIYIMFLFFLIFCLRFFFLSQDLTLFLAQKKVAQQAVASLINFLFGRGAAAREIAFFFIFQTKEKTNQRFGQTKKFAYTRSPRFLFESF